MVIKDLALEVWNYEIRTYLIAMFTDDIRAPVDKLIDELLKRKPEAFVIRIEDARKSLTKIIKSARREYQIGVLKPKPFPKLQRHRCKFCGEKWLYKWFWSVNDNRVRGIVKNENDGCEYCQELMTNECEYCFTKLEGVDWRIDEVFKCPFCGEMNYR